MLPPHRDLDHTVQLTQRAGARHQHAPPHHRANPEQPNLDLHDLGRVGIGRGRGWFNDWSGSLWGSRHPASLSLIAPPRRGHPRHPDALPPLRELRDLLRYRRKLVESQSAERNRLLKLLETANIKLASVLSDVFGVSGRAMLKALIEGT